MLCASLYIKRWPIPPSKPIFLNYISTFISPIKFHKEDRGTCLTVKSKGFSMALQRTETWKSLLIWKSWHWVTQNCSCLSVSDTWRVNGDSTWGNPTKTWTQVEAFLYLWHLSEGDFEKMLQVSELSHLTTEVRAAIGLHSLRLLVKILQFMVMDTLQGHALKCTNLFI